MKNVTLDKNKMKISRLINASKDLVFDAWTKPEHIKRWWGPDGFQSTITEMDVRAGGQWELIMHGPDGTDYKNRSEFVEVIPASKIVFNHISGPKYQMTVTFETQGDKTLLTIQMAFESEEQLDAVISTFKADKGLEQNVDKLETFLAGKMTEPLVVERTYNAPISMVWNAITNIDEMRMWYFDLAEFKPEMGFEFSFYGCGSEGQKYKHLCKVVNVIPGKKLSYTWRYEGYAGNSVLSFELFDEGDKTRLKLTHEGIESMSANGPDFQISSFTAGWTEILGTSLKNYLEKNNT